MPIPNADLPGHKALKDRTQLALDLCQEQPGIDFKRFQPWDAMKWRLIKTCLAMANLRGGGLIVIGVTEGSSAWELDGITPEHLATYDVDLVVDAVNMFASPHVDLDLVLMRHASGKDFLALQVREFELAPIGPLGAVSRPTSGLSARRLLKSLIFNSKTWEQCAFWDRQRGS
jgi:hypothetical protein